MRIGIIGASFAKAAYLPALRHVEGVEVVAVCNRRPESSAAVAKEFSIPRTMDRWEDLIGEEGPSHLSLTLWDKNREYGLNDAQKNQVYVQKWWYLKRVQRNA